MPTIDQSGAGAEARMAGSKASLLGTGGTTLNVQNGFVKLISKGEKSQNGRIFKQMILCNGAVFYTSTGNTETSIFGLADAGNFVSLSQFSGTDVSVDGYSADNNATSVYGTARSGNSMFFRGGNIGLIENSEFEINNEAYGNTAVNTYGPAVSGNQNVLNLIRDNSNVTLDNISRENQATAKEDGAGGDVDVISGTQNQVVKQIEDSNLDITNSATSNAAFNNFGGDSVSGISNNAQGALTSQISFENLADTNFASNEFGKSISGSENNIAQTQLSDITLDSKSYDNYAGSNYGDAVSGIQNNFQVLQGSNLTITDVASGNTALTYSGSAVSGSQTNANYLNDVNLTLEASGISNRAYVYGAERDSAVAGVDLNLAKVVDSNIIVDANAAGNVVRNSDARSDAIAGTDILVADASGNTIDVTAQSNNNNAQAVNGDAVAGNRVEVVGDDNTVYLDLTAQNNMAYSYRGDAIAGNYVVVQGANNNVPVTNTLVAQGNDATSYRGQAVINSNLNVGP